MFLNLRLGAVRAGGEELGPLAARAGLHLAADVPRRHPLLQLHLEEREDRRQRPVAGRGDDQRLHALEVIVPQDLRLAEEVRLLEVQPQERHQRGVFHQRDEVVARRRDDDPRGLRQDHTAHPLRVRHPQSVRGFRLPVTDGLDARSEDLGDIGPVVQAEPDDARLERREREDVQQRPDSEVRARSEAERGRSGTAGRSAACPGRTRCRSPRSRTRPGSWTIGRVLRTARGSAPG